MRRDWRQHVLIVCLLTAAVAAAVGFTCAAYNIAPKEGRSEFGDANHFFEFQDLDAARLQETLDAGEQWFGEIGVVGHRSAVVPGTDRRVDYRSQAPDSPFTHPLLTLVSGRYPNADDEAAVTNWIQSATGVAIGGTVDFDGVPRTVVGIVEDPSALNDEFVLIPPSQMSTSDEVLMYVSASEQQVQGFRPPGQTGRMISARGDIQEDVVAGVIMLVVSTLVLFLVALIAAASFTVIAQRRMPQLGMMAAVGATERHLRMSMIAGGAATGVVAGVFGVILGTTGWIVAAPLMEDAVNTRIDPWNVPWLLVVIGLVLAVITATAAAWWPGRAVSRVPVVVALSGRPPEPARLDRSALLSTILLAGGIAALVAGSRTQNEVTPPQAILICVGIVAVLAGVLMISPLAIRSVARLAGRLPIAGRLALRDLARYQARSGFALAAISLAVGIPVAIVATAAASENGAGKANLAVNQLMVRPDLGEKPEALPTADEVTALQDGVDDIAAALGQPRVTPIDVATENGRPVVLVRPADQGLEFLGPIAVSTPELLAEYGISSSDLDPGADLLTTERGDVALLDIDIKNQSQTRPDPVPIVGPVRLSSPFSSLPKALTTPAGLAGRGWSSVRASWLVETPTQLTSAQLSAAREIAVQHGLVIETRSEPESLVRVRTGAVAAGMLLALGILAMTVGLIRGEAARDLRTLTATGATGFTRRAITATTAGSLAALGSALGIVGAYVALVAGGVGHLAPLPVADLLVITLGTPALAVAGGWLFAGREPRQMARRPIE
jgi:putative ABC transport system permease protein